MCPRNNCISVVPTPGIAARISIIIAIMYISIPTFWNMNFLQLFIVLFICGNFFCLCFTPKTPPYGLLSYYGSFTELLEKLVPSTSWEVIEFFKKKTHITTKQLNYKNKLGLCSSLWQLAHNKIHLCISSWSLSILVLESLLISI